MSYIVGFESIVFSDSDGVIGASFPEFLNVLEDDLILIYVTTSIEDGTELVDAGDYTLLSSASAMWSRGGLVVYYKFASIDGEQPPDVSQVVASWSQNVALVIRGVDTTTPFADSDVNTETGYSMVCPWNAMTSTQSNQLAIYGLWSDNIPIDPLLTLQTMYKSNYTTLQMKVVNSGAVASFNGALDSNDQWVASGLIINNKTGDTSVPLCLDPVNLISEITGQTHNDDSWRQIVIDSGKCLDDPGTRKSWSVDMSKCYSGTTRIICCDNFSTLFSVGNNITWANGGSGVIRRVNTDNAGHYYITISGWAGSVPASDEVGTEAGTSYTCQARPENYLITSNMIRMPSFIERGRIVYISGMSSLGVSNGYYFIGDNGPIFNEYAGYYITIRSDASQYDASTEQTLTPNTTGTATITDCGMMPGDYSTDVSHNYSDGTSGVQYRNNNLNGNCRAFATPVDWTDEIIALFWMNVNEAATKHVWFLVIDNSGNWKIWLINNRRTDTQNNVVYPAFVQIASTETPYNTCGTFDIENVKYYGLLYQTTTFERRYSITTFNQYLLKSPQITGGSVNSPLNLADIKKWTSQGTRIYSNSSYFTEYLQSDVASQFVIRGDLKLGDGTTPSYFVSENKSLAFATQADGINNFNWNVDTDAVGVIINNCDGSFKTHLISSTVGWAFEANSDTINYEGSIFIKANPILQDTKTYNKITFVQCKQIIKNAASLTNCTIKESSDSAGALLYDTDESGSISNIEFIDNEYAIEVSGVTDFTLTNVSFNNSGTKDLNITATTGTINITISGGDTPTYDTAGATVNIVSGQSRLTVNVDQVNYEYRIYIKSSTPGTIGTTELQGVEDYMSNTFTYDYQYTEDVEIGIQIIKNGYKEYLRYITLTSNDYLLDVYLEEDTNLI